MALDAARSLSAPGIPAATVKIQKTVRLFLNNINAGFRQCVEQIAQIVSRHGATPPAQVSSPGRFSILIRSDQFAAQARRFQKPGLTAPKPHRIAGIFIAAQVQGEEAPRVHLNGLSKQVIPSGHMVHFFPAVKAQPRRIIFGCFSRSGQTFYKVIIS